MYFIRSLGFQRSVLAKLYIMIEKQSEALSILQVLLGAAKAVGGRDMLEDVFPKPIDSPEELEKMSAGLSDEEIKKKTVCRSYTLMNSNRYCIAMFWHLLKGILDGREWYLSIYRINSINSMNDVQKFCQN